MNYVAEHLIRQPSKEHMAPHAVMEGFIRSSMLNPTQKEDLDGLIKSSLPEKARDHKESGAQVPTMKVKPAATKYEVGTRHFPGSSFH